MDRTTHETLNRRGQAVVEVTIALGLILLIVVCTIGIVTTAKKEMKHDFLEGKDLNVATLISKANPTIKDVLGEKITPVENKKVRETLDALQEEGWVQVKTFHTEKGTITLLSRGDEKMGLIKTHEGTLKVEL